jgi:restriction endonuclease-like protein
MVASPQRLGSFPYAAELRRELSVRNRRYAAKHGLLSRESYGDPPVVCYLPSEDGSNHGNFLPETYRAILKNENWRKRLTKVHSQARHSLPREEWRWRELDASTSSDALLMNVFCYPGTAKHHGVFDLLGVGSAVAVEFGVKARVPLANGRADRTEVDMRLGDLLVEAKLTESGFQSAEPELVEGYRDFCEVLDRRRLPREGKRYVSYQLIRNVLAAYSGNSSFCVMADACRPDLTQAWYAIMSCVRMVDLRLRCKMITWQELAEILPRKLKLFLQEKYGIYSVGAGAESSLPSLFVNP